jgi:general secretion pathway protein D
MMKKYKFWLILGIIGLSLSEGFAQEAGSAVSSQADEILQRESIRRQELLLKATKSLEDAQDLIIQEKFDDARTKINDVIKAIPNSGEGSEVYKKANNLLSALDTVKAQEALQKKDYFGARTLAKSALQENPQNQQAVVVLEQTNKVLGIAPGQDAPQNPAIDSKFISNLNKVNNYIKSGRDFVITGQYDAARQAFQQALAIDPTNKVAANEILALQKKINLAFEAAHDSSNQERRTDVRGAWTEQFHLITQEDTPVQSNNGTPVSMKNNFLVSQKLRSIVIKNVNFTEATIDDAVRFLTEETRRLDPDGGGVNFLIQSDKVKQQSKPFSLRLSDMPVGDVLRYITNLAGVRYRVEEYAVFIVPLSSSDDVLVTREFPVRATFFDVDASASGASDAPKPRRVITTGVDNSGGAADDIRKSLESRGVQFAEGATAIYNAATGILTVRNTQDQIDLIEELVTENQGETLQVAVQAKLLEINQTDLDSLSLNYALYGSTAVISQALDPNGANIIAQQSKGHVAVGTNLLGSNGLQQSDGINSIINLNPSTGSAANPVNATTVPNRFAYSGVIDGNVFSALIEALSQKSSTDLMTAPSLVVNDGQQGKITVAREFYYPTEFDQPQVSPNTVSIGGGNSNSSINVAPTVIPAWPTQFESRPVGVVLTVKPSVTTDRKRVFLVIKPEITEFDGFINYGAQMYSTVGGYVGDITSDNWPVETFSPPRLVNNNVINQPVFSVRTVENAQLEVQDGYTMVLGGLIREDISTVNDKVPVLGDIPWIGRAFRSKAEQSVKRNLLIFVTVRILRPDGQPLNPSTGSMSNPVASGG